MQLLINEGVCVNQTGGSKKSTPAHSAVKWEKLLSLKTLVENNADLNITDTDGNTPQSLAEVQCCQEILEYLAELNQ